MRDGSDAIADWPILNALLNTSAGATWVSVHHGGGVGIGYSIHAGMVVVADGTREADEKLERVLTCDPGLGVVRHADAGYPEAIAAAARATLTSRWAAQGSGTMMIPERPALERRVLDALEVNAGISRPARADTRRAWRLRHRPHVAAAAAARPARPQRGTVRRRRADRHDARALPRSRCAILAVSRAVAAASPATASTGRASLCRRAGVPLPGPRRDRRTGDVPARRIPRAAHLRELPRASHGPARPRRGAGRQPQSLRADHRYAARAQRLLRDAPSRFEILPARR